MSEYDYDDIVATTRSVADELGRAEALRRLRDSGLSSMSATLVVAKAFSIAPSEARQVLHAHPDWTELLDASDAWHET
jgi:hypothetical protein